MSNSSIWPIDRTLLGTTTQSQSGPGSDGKLFEIELFGHFTVCKQMTDV